MPKGYPEPGLFQQSLGWVDKDGNGIRYQIIYSNAYSRYGRVLRYHHVPALAGAAAMRRALGGAGGSSGGVR